MAWQAGAAERCAGVVRQAEVRLARPCAGLHSLPANVGQKGTPRNSLAKNRLLAGQLDLQGTRRKGRSMVATCDQIISLIDEAEVLKRQGAKHELNDKPELSRRCGVKY